MSEAYAWLLGRIAVHNKLISNEQLREATLEQSRHPYKRLGEILVERGFIDSKQLELLLAAQQRAVAQQKKQVTPAPLPRRQMETPLTRAVDLQKIALQVELRMSSLPPPSKESVAPTRVPRAGPPPSNRKQDDDWRAWLDRALGLAVGLGASDVLVQGGTTVRYRRLGALESAGGEPLNRALAEALLRSTVPGELLAQLDARGDVDFVHTVAELGRFRTSVQRAHSGYAAVFHHLPHTPPTLAQLGLPSALARATQYADGLVVVAGSARSGKSSTLAALIDLINEERSDHIVTVEDPIEYLHPSKSCLVSQRQVGRDTSSLNTALRAALHEDADVWCVELRDAETIALALSAASSGHLVLATLHARSALRALEQLVASFPLSEQTHVRATLSQTLRAVVAQRLLRAEDDSAQPVVELLPIAKPVAKLIREGEEAELPALFASGAHGMVPLDAALAELYGAGRISLATARANAVDPARFVA